MIGLFTLIVILTIIIIIKKINKYIYINGNKIRNFKIEKRKKNFFLKILIKSYFLGNKI